MKIIFSGLESSGKSLQLSMQAVKLVERNNKWRRQSNIKRPILSNLYFKEHFELWAKKMGVPIIYWQNLDDLIKYDNCDVIIDEVGNYFDSRNWTSVTLAQRAWLTQAAKCGIEIYGAAQDFAQVDKSFRRLVQPGDLIHITKIMGSRRPAATKPPVKYIWGLCMRTRLDPMGYKEDKDKFSKSGLFGLSFFTIQRKYCDIFDTNRKIKIESTPAPLKKIIRVCPEDGYEQIRYV